MCSGWGHSLLWIRVANGWLSESSTDVGHSSSFGAKERDKLNSLFGRHKSDFDGS